MRGRFTVRIPPTPELGSYTFDVSGDGEREARREALSEYNRARAAEGHAPLTRLVRGAKLQPVPVDVDIDDVRFTATHPQRYRDPWRGGAPRVLQFHGCCVMCGRRTYGHDDGEDDPRGILGDHASSTLTAADYDYTGPDVPACFFCQNDTEERYAHLLRIAKRRWTPALRSTIDRKDVERDIVNAAAAFFDTEAITTVYEHGQWWVSLPSGAQWSVHDASGADAVDGFGFELVTPGDSE